MHQRVRVLCAILEARVANYSGKKLITVSFDVQGNSAGGGMALAPRRVTVRRRWSFFSCLLFLSPGLGFCASP
jgi:hypothetical protein